MSATTENVVTSPRRGEARTQAILDATIELIAELGFDRMTVGGVAGRARASKATIYRRWPNKTALTLDAVRRRSSVVHSLRETGSLRGDLELYLREAIGGTESIDGPLVAGLLTVAAHDPELAALLAKQFHDQQVPTLAALLDRARQRHEVGPDVDAHTIAELLPGALIMHMIVLGQPGDDAFVRQLLDEVLLPLLKAAQITVAPPSTTSSMPFT